MAQQPTPSTKLDQSIHILNTLMSSLKAQLDMLFDIGHEGKVSSEAMYSLNELTYSHGLILVASYLDEYTGYFIPALGAQSGKILPYIDRILADIDRFSGIKRYRNNVLAHNLRKNSKNVYLGDHLRDYIVPQNLNEYMLLVELLGLLTAKINEAFPDSYDRVLNEIRLAQQRSTKPLQPVLSELDIKALKEKLALDLAQLAPAN
jgi:hypothetical protein